MMVLVTDAGGSEGLQSQALIALQGHSPGRCGRLLLLLPEVARLAAGGRLERLFFRPTVGDVAIETLLRDIDSP